MADGEDLFSGVVEILHHGLDAGIGADVLGSAATGGVDGVMAVEFGFCLGWPKLNECCLN